MNGIGKGLEALLRENQSAIVQKWFEAVLSTYPEDSARFLRSQKDQFANPVGTTFLQELTAVFEELSFGEGAGAVRDFLDKIVRIRAVQDFSPASALAFVFDLKQAVRDLVWGKCADRELLEELARYEARVDDLALQAFNLYVECREQLYELRVREVKSSAFRLLKRAEMIVETPEEGSGPLM